MLSLWQPVRRTGSEGGVLRNKIKKLDSLPVFVVRVDTAFSTLCIPFHLVHF